MIITPVYHTMMKSISYVLWSEEVDYCIMIDCGDWETLNHMLKQINKRVEAVLLTHGHSDHICGLPNLLHEQPDVKIGTTIAGFNEIKDPKKNLSLYYGAPIVIAECEQIVLDCQKHLHFDGLCDIDLLFTPGHDVSCVSYLIQSYVFTGDAYIPGINTFSGFPLGNKEQAWLSRKTLINLEQKGYIIYCGHHSYDKLN